MLKFFKTLIPIELAQGLFQTGKNFCQVMFTANRRKKKLHLVDEYPEVPAKVQPRFRGRLQLLKDDEGEIICSCCNLCVKACPTSAIHIVAGKKEGRKTRIPISYDLEMERCIFCGFCVDSCNFKAIALNHQFELAVYNREELALGLGGAFQSIDRPSPVAKFSYSGKE
jgi:NADH-quinone oxidoreductase subunit I